jgi:hypothetical protein
VKDFKLKIDDIKTTDEDALDLFYSGMKSQETRRTMGGNLQQFLVDVCQDILDGDINQRAEQFVNIARKDQQRAGANHFGICEIIKITNHTCKK